MKFWSQADETMVMMEINRIEDKAQANISESIYFERQPRKACIYYPEAACTTPKHPFKICRGCPRCSRYVTTNVERSLFQHIKAYAISLLDKMNIQTSK